MPIPRPISVSMAHIIVQDWVTSLLLWLYNLSVTRIKLVVDGLLHMRTGGAGAYQKE